jgi:hypothetical protein
MSIRLPVAIAMASSVVLLSGANAFAADREFCGQYARAAENQVRGGLAKPSCANGMQGARWASDFRVHYDWCLGASFAEIGAERDARTSYLKACR